MAAELSTAGRVAGQWRRQGGGGDGSMATALAEQDRRQLHSGGKRTAGRRQQRSRIRAVLKKAAQWQRLQSGGRGVRKPKTGGGIAAASGLCYWRQRSGSEAAQRQQGCSGVMIAGSAVVALVMQG